MSSSLPRYGGYRKGKVIPGQIYGTTCKVNIICILVMAADAVIRLNTNLTNVDYHFVHEATETSCPRKAE